VKQTIKIEVVKHEQTTYQQIEGVIVEQIVGVNV
jgi:hypothetical protein